MLACNSSTDDACRVSSATRLVVTPTPRHTSLSMLNVCLHKPRLRQARPAGSALGLRGGALIVRRAAPLGRPRSQPASQVLLPGCLRAVSPPPSPPPLCTRCIQQVGRTPSAPQRSRRHSQSHVACVLERLRGDCVTSSMTSSGRSWLLVTLCCAVMMTGQYIQNWCRLRARSQYSCLPSCVCGSGIRPMLIISSQSVRP